MKTRSGILCVISLLLSGLVIGKAEAQDLHPCTSKEFAKSKCTFDIDRFAQLSIEPSGPTISCKIEGDTKTCTVFWTDNGRYKVGTRPEPDQPIGDDYIYVDVYYAVDPPTVIGSSLVCASVSSSNYVASTANDDNVQDFDWVVSPSNAYTSLDTSGSPDGANLQINWNAGYVGLVTITSYAYGYAEDRKSGSRSVNRHAMEVFEANLITPQNVCEGVQFSLFAEVSHPAEINWFLDDSNQPFSTALSAPAIPTEHATYRLKATPSASNDCLIDYDVIERTTRTGSINLHVTPRLIAVDITNNVALRCNGGGNMNLTFDAFGPYTQANWSITSSESVSPGSIAGGVLNWNADFIGAATLKVNVTGCNGVISDEMHIGVAQAPAHKSLVGTSSPICLNTTTPISLTNLGTVIPETYQLMKVLNPGAGETVMSVSTTNSSGWSLGPGTYFVTTTAPNCPTDVTDRFVVNPLIHAPIFGSSVGTLDQSAGAMTLTVCEAIGVNLTVSGATNLKWYKYNDVCLSNNLATIPPLQRWQFCHQKFLRPDGTPYDGATQLPLYSGTVNRITITGEDDVCHEAFERTIDVRTRPGITFIGINPLMTARVMGPGTTSFEMEYTGILEDLEWQITPSTAGTISSVGTVTWSPFFTSYENGGLTQPVTIKAKAKGCQGWISNYLNVNVVPVLDYDENRIRTFIPQVAMSSPETVLNSMTDPFKVKASASYFDGLGRNVENVQYFSSTPNRDLVELKVFDEFGREAIKNLPFAKEHSFTYPSDAIVRQAEYYNSSPAGVVGDAKPYAKTIFEPSPLNRVVEQGAPGELWQPGTGHTVIKQYLLNVASEVLNISYSPSTNGFTLTAAPPDSAAFYKPNTLTVNKTIDEEHNDVLEFVDKEGRIICKKVKAPGGVYASTYYIYDDFGNLVVVLPPEAVERIIHPTGN